MTPDYQQLRVIASVHQRMCDIDIPSSMPESPILQSCIDAGFIAEYVSNSTEVRQYSPTKAARPFITNLRDQIVKDAGILTNSGWDATEPDSYGDLGIRITVHTPILRSQLLEEIALLPNHTHGYIVRVAHHKYGMRVHAVSSLAYDGTLYHRADVWGAVCTAVEDLFATIDEYCTVMDQLGEGVDAPYRAVRNQLNDELAKLGPLHVSGWRKAQELLAHAQSQVTHYAVMVDDSANHHKAAAWARIAAVVKTVLQTAHTLPIRSA